MAFKDLQKSTKLFILDKTSLTPKYQEGIIEQISIPRPESLYNQSHLVVDINVVIDGEKCKYVATHSDNLASTADYTIATKKDLLADDIQIIKTKYSTILEQVEEYQTAVIECDELLKSVSTQYAVERAQGERIDKLETGMKDLQSTMGKMCSMLEVVSQKLG